MNEILTHVRASLKTPETSGEAPHHLTEAQPMVDTQTKYADAVEPWDAFLDVDGNDVEFDDMGEGVGVEGDLDINDD